MIKRIISATDTLKELFAYYVLMMGISAALYSVAEKVPFTTALYWAGITATTTGYGDISPHTAFGRALSVILANVSVFLLGPLIIARMLQSLVNDPHSFDHSEQEEIKADLKRLVEVTGLKEPLHGFDRFGHDYDPDLHDKR